VIAQAIKLGLKRLWLQPGAEHAEAIRKAEEAGVDVYLTKPVEPRHLLKVIDDLAAGEGAFDKAKSKAEPPAPSTASPDPSSNGRQVTRRSMHPRSYAESSPAINSAVIDSGTRRIVLVQTGEGRFEPREVKTGPRNEHYV